MNITVRYPFTGTSGAVNGISNQTGGIIKEKYKITQNIREEIGGIQSIHELYKKLENQNGKLNSNYNMWYELFDNIKKEILKGDPIEYLMYLYSKNGEYLSIEQIFKFLKREKFCNHKNSSSIRKFFSKTLGWNIRPNSEPSDNTKKLIKNKTRNENKRRKQKNEEKIIDLKDFLLSGQNKEQQKPFDIETFIALRNTIKKTKYILDINGIISKNNFESTIKILYENYGCKITAEAIQIILDGFEEPRQNGLKFNRGRISEINNKIK